jgi:hypothetical protein
VVPIRSVASDRLPGRPDAARAASDVLDTAGAGRDHFDPWGQRGKRDGQGPGWQVEHRYRAVMEVLPCPLRLDGHLIYVIADGVLAKTLPSPVPPPTRPGCAAPGEAPAIVTRCSMPSES